MSSPPVIQHRLHLLAAALAPVSALRLQLLYWWLYGRGDTVRLYRSGCVYPGVAAALQRLTAERRLRRSAGVMTNLCPELPQDGIPAELPDLLARLPRDDSRLLLWTRAAYSLSRPDEERQLFDAYDDDERIRAVQQICRRLLATAPAGQSR